MAAGAENPRVRFVRLGLMVLSVRLDVPCQPPGVLLIFAAENAVYLSVFAEAVAMEKRLAAVIEGERAVYADAVIR